MVSSGQQTFGKYKLIRRLAFGGMAEVFLGAVHGEAGFSKTVVLKRLHPRLNEDSEFVQMLIDEARITSQLAHSNICQVLDLGSVDGSYYIAMEYIAGEDLRTLLDHFARRGEFIPVEAAVHVVSEVLAGLDYAHAKEGGDGESLGVIHRDVSPQNVLISYEGEVKVIDFGIAKARSRMVQTQAGVIKGKFRYMSPEQASGQHMDHRTDVFAAGVVLYELLRGRPHSQNVPDTEVLRRMREAEFEPIQRSREEVPDELLKIISRALQRKVKKRWATAGEFRRALMGYLQGKGTIFGRSELAQLMKSVFPVERRRERSGQSNRSKRESVRVRMPDPFAPETPSGTAIQGESEVTTGKKDVSAAAFAATRATFTPEGTAATTSERLLREQAAADSGLSRVPTDPIEDSVFTSAQGSASAEARKRVISGEIENSQPLVAVASDQQTVARAPQQAVRGAPAQQPSEASLRATIARPSQSASQAPPLQRDVYQHVPADPARQVEDSLVATRYGAGEPLPPPDEGIPLLRPPAEQVEFPPEREPEPEPPSEPEPARRRGGAFSRGAPRPVEAGRKLPRQRRRVDPQQIREDAPRASDPPSAASASHTEQVERGGGSGAAKALLALLIIGGIAAAAFFAGREYFGGQEQNKPGATDLSLAPVKRRPADAGAKKAPARARWVRVRVESSPPGAAIKLCERDTQKVTPATIRQRRRGRCELVLTLSGYESYSTSLRLSGKKRLKVNATLRQLRQTPPPNIGVLKVTSIQEGIVYVNGKMLGKTPGLKLNLRPGRYRVRVRFPTLGTSSRPREITIYGGRTSQLHFDAP